MHENRENSTLSASARGAERPEKANSNKAGMNDGEKSDCIIVPGNPSRVITEPGHPLFFASLMGVHILHILRDKAWDKVRDEVSCLDAIGDVIRKALNEIEDEE